MCDRTCEFLERTFCRTFCLQLSQDHKSNYLKKPCLR